MPDRPIEVWIVEDDAAFRSTVQDLLSRQRHLSCRVAVESCEEALDALGRESMRPQVILMDLVLPGMDGTEGVRRIQEIDPNIHVIVLTVYGDDDRIFDALCAGACGYLLKPGTEGRIVAAIETALEGGAPITPFIARRVLTIFTRYITKRGDYQLTQREREVLQLLVEGSSQREIAARLSVSPHTIDTHIRHIYSRLKVRSQGAAVAKAIRERLL